MTKYHQLDPIPDRMGMISDADYDRLSETSTVRLPKPPSRCGTCGGKREFTSWNREGKEVVLYKCNCEDQYLASLELISRGIDGDYQRLDWYDLTDMDSAALETALEYVEHHEGFIHQGIGLSIHGNPGTGKSLLSYLIAKRLIQKGYDLYFAQHNHMLDGYKAGWKSKDAEEEFKARYYRTQILVIDDFGTERNAREARGVDETLLDQVLRTRASNNLVTILTTNLPVAMLDPQQANSRYDVRVRSLLSGKNLTIDVKGEDFRPKRILKQKDEAKRDIKRPVVL